MPKTPDPQPATQTYVNRITKALDRICSYSGRQPREVYDDWLGITLVSLETLPVMAAAVIRTGQPAPDPPAVTETFNRINARYGRDPDHLKIIWDSFREAFAALVDSTTAGYMDVVGQVFMTWGCPNPDAGQFFTPWDLCLLTAKMTIGDGAAMVHERIKEAIHQSIPASAMLMAGITVPQDQGVRFLLEQVLPLCAEYYEPVTISDPCCGSGSMLLAFAACFPDWMVQYGLVQFYGQDIDRTCVTMAQVNTHLYGLNGIGIKWALALSEAELSALPQPYQAAYTQAQAAQTSGDLEQVAAIASQVRGVQLAMFEIPAEVKPVEPAITAPAARKSKKLTENSSQFDLNF